MGTHESTNMKTCVWITPRPIIESLGEFDTDPCSPVNRPWDTAKIHYNVYDNGLINPWIGRVWCNPPYGKHTSRWLKKCAEHRNAIALVFARTETKMFFDYVWPHASAIFFFKGRIHFCNERGIPAKGNAGSPSCLIAYGDNNVEAIKKSGLKGKLLHITMDDKQEISQLKLF